MHQEELYKQIERLRYGWKWGRRKAALELGRIGSKDVLGPLLNALKDKDLKVRENARKSLGNLRNQDAIDELCMQYIEERDAVLSEVIEQRHYQAREPQKVRILINLKINKIKAILKEDEEDVVALILHEAIDDPDDNIRKGAIKCFEDYPRYANVIYHNALYKEKPQLIPTLESKNLLPQNPSILSLYLFLKEDFVQFDRFDTELDFINKAYQEAGERLRAQIYQQIKKSGNPKYLRIIQEEMKTGRRMERREFKDSEMKAMVDYCVAQKDWERLLKLLRYAIYPFAIRIVMELEKSGWIPVDKYDKETLKGMLEGINSAKKKAGEDYMHLVEGELGLDNPFCFFDNPQYQKLTNDQIEKMIESPDPAQNAKGIYLAYTRDLPVKKDFMPLVEEGHWMIGQALLYTGLQKNIDYENFMKIDLLKGNKILQEQNVANIIYRISVSNEEFLKVHEQAREWLARQDMDDRFKDICMAMLNVSEFLLKRNSTLPDIADEIEEIFEMTDFDLDTGRI